MIRDEEVFYIGKITKRHGINGEVELAFTDDVFDCGDSEYLVLNINGIKVPFFWEEYRFKGNETALFKFEEIDSEDAARQLVGCEVYYPLSMQGDTMREKSWSAFTGYRILDENENELGIVEQVDDRSENVLFGIRRTESGDDLTLVPIHPDFVLDHDNKRRVLVLRLPEGLLSLNE